MALRRGAQIRQVSAESMAEKQRRISGQGAAVEMEHVHALEDEMQRLRNELADKEEVRLPHRTLRGKGEEKRLYCPNTSNYRHLATDSWTT